MPMSNPTPQSSTSNFTQITSAAYDEFRRVTGRDLTTQPFSAELDDCKSPDGILDILGKQAQAFNRCRQGSEKLLKLLNPIVYVLFIFADTLGEGIGMVHRSPAKAIFAGIAVLLGAVRDVIESYDTLIHLFERIDLFVKRLKLYESVRLTTDMIELLGKILAQVLRTLALATKTMKERRIKQILKRLMGRRDIEDALSLLDKLTKEENLMAVVGTLVSVDRTGRILDELVKDKTDNTDKIKGIEEVTNVVYRNTQVTRAGVDQIRGGQLRGEIRRWLSPPQPSINHNAACVTQHKGTGKWFTQGKRFAEWKKNGTLLWIRGNPGSGKSVLCSAIIEDVKRMQKTTPALIAYYYFDFKDAAKRDVRGLLSSLLTQLGDTSESCMTVLSNLYAAYRDGSEQPSEEALVQCLKVMLGSPGQVPIFIIVDALDECSNISGTPSARKKVLDFMKELIGWGHRNLYLCLSSRPEHDIVSTLTSMPRASRPVSLHEEVGQREDINDYIRHFVLNNESTRKWRTEDKELVINTLSQRADGMFRWVFCQLDSLSRCFPQGIRKALNELPITLDGTYERTLQGIAREKKEHAHRLFQCLVAAIRPLRVVELAEIFAINFDPNTEPKLEDNWRPGDPEEAILSTCSTLITIVGDGDSKIVQFSHFSVKEFLTSDRLQSFYYHIPLNAAHSVLTRASLTVLLQFDEMVDKTTCLTTYPLASYAARHWVDHAQFDEEVALQSKDPMERLFNPKERHLEAWIRLHNVDKGSEPSTNDLDDHGERRQPSRATPLYYATLCGFAVLAEHLIDVQGEDVNAKCGRHGSPLHAASYEGHVAAARVLVDKGANKGMTNAHKRSPLGTAYDGGHPEVMRLLLERGADVDEPYAYAARLLHISSHQGQAEIVELLLEYKANVNARDSVNQTPLYGASTNGHVDVVELLLEKGADVNAETTSQSTPLHGASESGHVEVVEMLLKYGADVNIRNRRGRSALEVAKSNGQTKIVKLLSEHSAEKGKDREKGKGKDKE